MRCTLLTPHLFPACPMSRIPQSPVTHTTHVHVRAHQCTSSNTTQTSPIATGSLPFVSPPDTIGTKMALKTAATPVFVSALLGSPRGGAFAPSFAVRGKQHLCRDRLFLLLMTVSDVMFLSLSISRSAMLPPSLGWAHFKRRNQDRRCCVHHMVRTCG